MDELERRRLRGIFKSSKLEEGDGEGQKIVQNGKKIESPGIRFIRVNFTKIGCLRVFSMGIQEIFRLVFPISELSFSNHLIAKLPYCYLAFFIFSGLPAAPG